MSAWIIILLVAQFALALVIGTLIWGLRRRIARAEGSASLANMSPEVNSESRSLLAELKDVLCAHANDLGLFERVLDSSPTEGSQTPEIAEGIDNVRQSNQQLEEAFDKTTRRLTEMCGELLEDERTHLREYREQTLRLDQQLEEASSTTIIGGVFCALLEMVRSLRQDNEELRREISVVQDQLREQMARAESAEQLARVDALTQLPNRLAFDEQLAQRQSEFERNRQPYSLVLFDLDRFKSVNDRYGHPAGDAVLSMVGRLMRDHLRGADFACRFGGEEFALLLSRCSEESARQVAEHHSHRIERARLYFQGRDLQVTISAGVASARSDQSTTRLLQNADQALYEAKARGGNCVCVYSRLEEDAETRCVEA